MKPRVVSILLLLCTIVYSFKSQQETYNVLAGIKLLKPYRIINLHYKSKTLCASYCLGENGICNSANYNKLSKACELNEYSPENELSNIAEDVDWDVLYVKDDTWELAFRGTSGIGESLYSSYKGLLTSTSIPEVGCHLTHTLTCTTHYRNHAILDNWESINIETVKVALYKNNVKVVDVIFWNDMFIDSYMDWFSEDRLISSTYKDLTDPNHIFNQFSITGANISSEEIVKIRRFYINKLYISCAYDYGWMAVFEGGSCDYEKGFPIPYFAYLPNNKVGQWKKGVFKSADVFAIFVQRVKDNGSEDAGGMSIQGFK